MEAYQMKPSGVEWQGLVPTHWRRDKLFRLCNKMGSGGTPTSTNESYYGGDIPWIQSGDLTDSYVSETSKKITNEALQHSSAKMFPQGTLLVAMYGATIGKLGIMEMDAATNQACCALQVSEKFISKFTYYLMLDIRDFLLTEAYGGGQSNISQETLKQQYMLIPKPSEQQGIADYLDQACNTINKTIEVKKKQLEKLAAYRKSVIHEAVTKGLDKNVPMKPSGVEWLGEVPEHWKVSKLKNFGLGTMTNGIFKKKEHYGKGTKLINVTDLYQDNNIVDYEGLDRVDCDTNEVKRYAVNDGDIFFVRSSLKLEGIGVSALAEQIKENTVFECHIIRFRPNQDVVHPKFILYQLNSECVQGCFVASSKTVTMTTISQDKIASIKLAKAPIDEQQSIANYLDQTCNTIDQSKQVIEKQVAKLTEYRKSLIHECVTGKKRIYQGEV